MNCRKLRRILEDVGEVQQHCEGSCLLAYHGLEILIVADHRNNRVRFMAPVVDDEDLPDDELRRLLAANYNRAIDAKYALSQGIVWALFTHPLHELSDEQVLDAIDQVANLVDNYGTTYNS